MQAPTPEPEHLWLKQLVGEWTYEGECVMGPDQPVMKTTGKETVTTLGELWTLGHGTMDDGKSLMTLGYDPKHKHFVGTFVASMMTHQWVYKGSLSEDKKILVLEAEGPNFAGEGLCTYQDRVEILDENHRTLSSWIPDGNGGWNQFMKMTYTRSQAA